MKILRLLIAILLLTTAVRAAPVTIEEFLAQDPQQPTGTVTIIETQECCEDKAGMPWWPFLFAGAIPLAFIDRSDDHPEILIPPTTSPTPESVPEPSTLSLGLLTVAGIFVWRRRR